MAGIQLNTSQLQDPGDNDPLANYLLQNSRRPPGTALGALGDLAQALVGIRRQNAQQDRQTAYQTQQTTAAQAQKYALSKALLGQLAPPTPPAPADPSSPDYANQAVANMNANATTHQMPTDPMAATAVTMMQNPATQDVGNQLAMAAIEKQEPKQNTAQFRPATPDEVKQYFPNGVPPGHSMVMNNQTKQPTLIGDNPPQTNMGDPNRVPGTPLPGSQEQLAQLVSQYKFDPSNPVFRRMGPDVFARAVELNPDFDATQYKPRFQTAMSFGPGGKNGQTLIALKTASQHLNLLQQASTALGNGDIQSLNSVRQAWLKQTGSELPTDFAALMPTVAAEVAKANGSMAEGDRIDIQAPLKNANSPQQLAGSINQLLGLLGGKANALRSSYVSGMSGPNTSKEKQQMYEQQFNSMLTPELLQRLPGQGQAPQAKSDPLGIR